MKYKYLYNILYLIILLISMFFSCLRLAEERADLDLQVGKGSAGGVSFTVENGLAAIRSIHNGYLELWSQSPSLRIHAVTSADSVNDWTIKIRNCMPDAELYAQTDNGGLIASAITTSAIPTVLQWSISLPSNSRITLDINTPDSDDNDQFRFAYLSDIQEAIDKVQDIFIRMNQDPSIRFVVSSGDLTTWGKSSELRRFQRELELLNIPFFSTVGNHELGTDPEDWFNYFGRANVNFSFKATHFSLIDSANATIDPTVYNWLDSWLETAKYEVHIFVTHYPPIDPEGIRAGSFSSRKEAAKLLAKLAKGNVDVTIYGHIHSFYSFSNAGIPAYISGGGGAIPERLDGIGRHFLTIDVSPGSRIDNVSIVRID